jgi:phage terminase large subunit-like protein
MTPRDERKYKEILKEVGNKEEADLLYLKYKCLTDLYFLGSEVLGMSKIVDGSTGRKRLDPVFHKWVADTIQPEEDTLLIVPRGHMKSAWVKVKIVQLVLKNPNIRIGLFSRTSGLVESQLAEIKQLFCTPLLMQIFPELIPEPGKRYANWTRSTANELTITRSLEWGRIPNECQIEAWGAGATITGRHYDIIVMDDILNEKSCSTVEQIRKMRDWYSYIQSIKDPEGYEIMVGTRYHFADLYGTVIKEKWYKDRVFVRSVVENGRPIYSFFTLAMLAKIRQRQGAYEYSCQYENNPIPKDDQVFPPPYPVFDFLPPGKYTYYMTVDPAATTKRYSDETAIVITAVNSEGYIYVVDAYGYKKNPDENASEILRMAIRYSPILCGMELGLQEGLQYLLDIKIREYEQRTRKKIRTRFIKIDAPRSMSKEEKIGKHVGGLLRAGRIFIQEDLSELMAQMEFFPKAEHDDILDALAMQMGIIKELGGSPFDVNERQPKNTLFAIFAKKPDHSWEGRFVS